MTFWDRKCLILGSLLVYSHHVEVGLCESFLTTPYWQNSELPKRYLSNKVFSKTFLDAKIMSKSLSFVGSGSGQSSIPPEFRCRVPWSSNFWSESSRLSFQNIVFLISWLVVKTKQNTKLSSPNFASIVFGN